MHTCTTCWLSIDKGLTLSILQSRLYRTISQILCNYTASIKSIHIFARRHLHKPLDDSCEYFYVKPYYDLANISSKYNPETYIRSFYEWFGYIAARSNNPYLIDFLIVYLTKQTEFYQPPQQATTMSDSGPRPDIAYL